MSTVEPQTRRAGVRALPPSAERIALRASEEDGGQPLLFGHFARFNEWTEIDSWVEGHFMERLAPTAFDKTIRENRDKIQVLFQHGRDPMVGDKPIAAIETLKRDGTEGAYHESRLLEGVPELIVSGLRNSLYGQSFKMQVMREEIQDEPEPSEQNPKGIPESTIKEVRLYEFGPVTFPAYANTTPGLRSLTDDVIFDAIKQNPERFRGLLGAHEFAGRVLAPAEQDEHQDAPDEKDAVRKHTSFSPRRDSALASTMERRTSALRV